MSWKTEITPIVRVLIDDIECEQYTDNKLHKIIITGAKIVVGEVKLTNDYVVCASDQTITPDPTASTPKDDEFITLVSLKTACLIFNADMKLKALFDGTSAKCGPTSISTSSGSTAWQYFKDFGPCITYQGLKDDIEFKNPICEGVGLSAVLSPFISNNYRCCDCHGPCNCYRIHY